MSVPGDREGIAYSVNSIGARSVPECPPHQAFATAGGLELPDLHRFCFPRGIIPDKEETMKNLIVGMALAALLSIGSGVAGEKKSGNKAEGTGAASSQSADAGRGGLSEWPVSKEEADWKHAAPASTGASSGTSGSSEPSGSSGSSGSDQPR
jgi:hypothetical protein